MEISVKVKPEVSKGAVREKLFKDDFVVKQPGWKVHSFAYNPPRGRKTNVELDLHLSNAQGQMKKVNVKFNYAVSNVQKVLNVLSDKEVFKIDPNILAAATVEEITENNIQSKYPYLKIAKMDYQKPLDVSRTGTLVFELDIDGIIYPYSQVVKFAKSKYKDTFDNISSDMFEVKVGLDSSGKFYTEEIINKTGSKKINVYDSQIIGINESRTFDVMLFISGNSKNKSIIVQSKALGIEQSFNSIIDRFIRFETSLVDSPRQLKPEELILNKPSWLHVEKVTWLNPDEITSNIGRYQIEFHVAKDVITKDLQVMFGHSNDHAFINLISEQNIQIDDAYLSAPKMEISVESASLISPNELSEEVHSDIQFEYIRLADVEIDPSRRVLEYNISVILGGVRKIFRKNLMFQLSLEEFTIREFEDGKEFVTKIPAVITDNDFLVSMANKFLEDSSLKSFDVATHFRPRDLADIEILETPLDIVPKEINIKRFDTHSRGDIIINFGFSIGGDKKLLYKEQPIPSKVSEEIVLETFKPEQIKLIDESILLGIRPSYFNVDQFKITKGFTLSHIEIIKDEQSSVDLAVNFTVLVGKSFRIIKKNYTFTKPEEAIVLETPQEASDNEAYLETVDLSSLVVFVEIDKEPPYEITPSMFSGVPEKTHVLVDYKWPQIGSGEVVLNITLVRGSFKKDLELPITFEKPMTKETLKSYKLKSKKGRSN